MGHTRITGFLTERIRTEENSREESAETILQDQTVSILSSNMDGNIYTKASCSVIIDIKKAFHNVNPRNLL